MNDLSVPSWEPWQVKEKWEEKKYPKEHEFLKSSEQMNQFILLLVQGRMATVVVVVTNHIAKQSLCILFSSP